MSELSIILTTFPSEEVAASVVRELLKDKLIACGTLLLGARSLYHWKGKVEESAEVVVLLKTNQVRVDHCMERLTELHPYEVPEIVLIDPESVSAPYIAWVNASLMSEDSLLE